jgi:hypothetical protein
MSSRKKNGRWNITITLVLMVTIFQIASCHAADAELERNKQLWQESNVADYDFVIIRYQGGMYVWAPVLVQVRGRKAISMKPTKKVEELVKVDYGDFDTIDKTFDVIQRSYDKGDKVTVTYNEKFGYPEKIKVQPKGGGVDSVYSINISEFEIIKSDHF